MNWNARIGMERDMLERIVVLLLALAGLAERAAGSSRPVRCRVLWALQQADAVVREFVTGSSAARRQSQALTALRSSADPADAINLALSLRLLALVVQDMAAQLRRPRFLHQGRPERRAGQSRNSLDGVIESLWNAALTPVERRDSS